jgi:hypothetical protein
VPWRRVLGHELGDGHEPVAAVAQPPDDHGQGLSRLTAGAAAVVHQHDRSGVRM